jgi:type III secretion system FlhB-like substrate exporter
MEIVLAVREALELQILEEEPERAATAIGTAVGEHGAVPVAAALLDTASVGLRRMVEATDESYDLAELLSQLALDGAIPEHRLELLTEILTAAAATAGGIRPPVDALHTRLGEQDLLFGAWLGLLTALRVASLAMEITETELLEDVLLTVDVDS